MLRSLKDLHATDGEVGKVKDAFRAAKDKVGAAIEETKEDGKEAVDNAAAQTARNRDEFVNTLEEKNDQLRGEMVQLKEAAKDKGAEARQDIDDAMGADQWEEAGDAAANAWDAVEDAFGAVKAKVEAAVKGEEEKPAEPAPDE